MRSLPVAWCGYLTLILFAMFILSSCGNNGDSETDEPHDVSDVTATVTSSPVVASTSTPEVTPTPDRTPASSRTTTPTSTGTQEVEPETLMVEEYEWEIIETFPHDREAFTQGFEIHDGRLFESTGLRGDSSLREVDLQTGEVLRQADLDNRYFGEGLTILDEEIYQLTWQENTAFVYDLESFDVSEEFTYETEGWALANDGTYLYMTDGTSTIYIRDPDTFERVDEFEVIDEDGPVERLNELEWIDGLLWANVWQEDIIVVIDPDNGHVLQRLDFTGLPLEADVRGQRIDVLNGIAWDDEDDRLLITGKLWPVVYQVEIIPIND